MPLQESTTDAVCLGCGCLCDDIALSLSGGGAATCQNACDLGKQWFAQLKPGPTPACLIDTQPATHEEALARAIEILHQAKLPLVCGLRGAATDAGRAAIAIADQLGGCVDWTTSATDAAPILSFQTHGAATASLGEVAGRADLVIFWRCDPATTHPRHFERYSLRSVGLRPQQRTSVYVGSADAQTAGLADVVIDVTTGDDVASFQILRGWLEGKSLHENAGALTGAAVEKWRELADRIRESRYTAIFYGDALKQQGAAVIGELTLLAQHVQATTRLATLPLGSGDNAAGVENAMTWQTGYPMAVSFARGYPEYEPGAFSTEALLTSGEADAALVVSLEGLTGLSEQALARLRGIPAVVLANGDASAMAPDITFRVAPLGATACDSVYRSDGVALPLDNTFCHHAPCHAQVLDELHQLLSATALAAVPETDAEE